MKSEHFSSFYLQDFSSVLHLVIHSKKFTKFLPHASGCFRHWDKAMDKIDKDSTL